METKISQFNQEGGISILIDLLNDDGFNLGDIVHSINDYSDKEHLKLLLLQPLKVSDLDWLYWTQRSKLIHHCSIWENSLIALRRT